MSLKLFIDNNFYCCIFIYIRVPHIVYFIVKNIKNYKILNIRSICINIFKHLKSYKKYDIKSMDIINSKTVDSKENAINSLENIHT